MFFVFIFVVLYSFLVGGFFMFVHFLPFGYDAYVYSSLVAS